MKLIVTSILLLVGAMGTACTPSLTHLVEERRFADAICLAKHQEQANVTLAAVARELEPRVLVQRAPASSWTDPMGEDGNTASEHLAAVRTMWVMNRITARSVTATVALVLPVDGAASAGRFTGGEYPRRAGVARVLGERPPKQHEESWNEHVASVPPRNPFELFLSLFQTDTIHHERLVDPAPAEWAAQAPRTTALFDALTRGANAQGSSSRATNDARPGSSWESSWRTAPRTGTPAVPRSPSISRQIQRACFSAWRRGPQRHAHSSPTSSDTSTPQPASADTAAWRLP